MREHYAATTLERHTVFPARHINARLYWLTNALAESERRERLFRNPREEEQMCLMSRPLSTPQAFARLGLLLGLLPPAAIFFRLFLYPSGLKPFGGGDSWWFPFCLFMNVICCIVGRAMGAKFGKAIEQIEPTSWSVLLLLAAAIGSAWGALTGGAGGALFFGVGAIFGMLCAAPVGTLAFIFFTPLHRLLARGGMIDARHFWPLACGVTMTITALILSPHIFPY
ncbi:MAG: hypothetical protein H0T45_16260 [Pyrinomonadaceae bacterium]|nr:hypothetical protein [Pyrinomonadaceae bacterium]